MSEEKDLDQIENDSTGSEEGFGGLEDFVELDDLQNLEGLGDLSALGDISDLGDLSDLPGVVTGTGDLDDLDVDIDIPLPVMEEQEEAEQLKEAVTEPEEVPDIQEETEEENPAMPEEADAEKPEETDIPDKEETEEIPEEADTKETLPESGTGEEEPEELSLDINDINDNEEIEETVQEEDSGKEPPVILEKNVSDDAEEDISLDDIALDAGEDIVPEEDEAMEQDISLEDITEDIAQKESLPEETAGEEEDSGTDAMLEGLLGNLDINSTPDEEAAPPEAAGMEDSGDDMLDGMLDSLGIPEAVPAENAETAETERTRKKPPRELPPDEPASEDGGKKPGLFKRLFGNVVTDEIAEAERKAKEEEEEQAALKAEEEAKAKEEKEAKKAAAAEAKEAKKAEKAAKKAEKAEQKAAKKAEKAAKKEAEKEEEEQEVVGKLNKAGVIIVVAGAAAILAGVILGTNIFEYKSSKSEAERYFTLQRYSDAYNEARGTKLEDKDPELYDKIVTVMKVQQSLDTYSSYAIMKYYPDALNALLRGLQKYDDNIDMAMDLEIEGDMKVCKNKILSILKDEFGLSEQKAYEILSLDDSAYTKRVVGIAKKKI